jgi:hypothetical protein
MKLKMLFFALFLMGFSQTFIACSPSYVRIQPTYAEEFRSPCPSNNHVWVDGNWRYNRPIKAYTRGNGYWLLPNVNRKYESGQWRNNSRGFYWTPGRWR